MTNNEAAHATLHYIKKVAERNLQMLVDAGRIKSFTITEITEEHGVYTVECTTTSTVGTIAFEVMLE